VGVVVLSLIFSLLARRHSTVNGSRVVTLFLDGRLGLAWNIYQENNYLDIAVQINSPQSQAFALAFR